MKSTTIAIVVSILFTCCCGVFFAYNYIQRNELNKVNPDIASVITKVKPEVKSEVKSDYNFNQQTTKITLPRILQEISGLTVINQNTLACVQDEDGIVFIYDLQKKEIKRQFKFDKKGDYEGITRVGNSLYVLRSDGKLFEIKNFKSEDFEVKKYDTDIPVKDSEGLTYDATNNRLLIAGKIEPKGKKYKDKRVVFAFDLTTKKIIKEPAYEFSKKEIKEFVEENKKGVAEKNDASKLKINPSGIDIHPITGQLYVLSSKDNLLYIFNQESQIEAVYNLDKGLFNQAEGITFLDNGDLFISNEGEDFQATLLFFSYKK
ncbi:MAG: hypothetical protein ACI85O_003392 [Saprospiraceae bacterium]|jgi:uncharacterized protein YjiK